MKKSKEKKQKEMEEEEDTPWYELDEMEDNIVNTAIAHARKEFHKYLIEEFQWEDFHPVIRIEVRELRSGDGSLGKGYLLDEIQEHEEHMEDCCDYECDEKHEHFKEPTERKEIQ